MDTASHSRHETELLDPPRQPFDTRELADFPFPDERDPPYRPWWVEYSPDSAESGDGQR